MPALIQTIEEASLPPLAVLLLIVLFYLAIGCLMDSLSMVLLTSVPIYELVTGLGYDGVWFGILLVTVAEIDMITPPIGIILFVIRGVTPGLEMGGLVRGVLPFILADIIGVALLVTFPGPALVLPRYLGF